MRKYNKPVEYVDAKYNVCRRCFENNLLMRGVWGGPDRAGVRVNYWFHFMGLSLEKSVQNNN